MPYVEVTYETLDEMIKNEMREGYNNTREFLEQHFKNPEDNWMHPDDVAYSYRILAAYETLFQHYSVGNEQILYSEK